MRMTQVLADAYGCGTSIEDPTALLSAGQAAAAAVGARIQGETVVSYAEHGLTVALFLAQSHIVLSTWPEHRLLMIDLLLCTPEMDYDMAIDVIAARHCATGKVIRHRVARRIAPSPQG